MPRISQLFCTLCLTACVSAAPPARAPAHATPSPPPAVALPRTRAVTSTFRCTEVIGLTVTAEWYGAGFEALVDDERFQARTRPHTFVDQWADPAHEAWSSPLTSPCSSGADNPDRVVLFVASWQLTSREDWIAVLERVVTTVSHRYAALRELQLYTVLRGPGNQTCGDPKSVVDPMIDDAIAEEVARHPGLVQAGPRLEAPDCSVFEQGGPHFSAAGRTTAAKLMADALE